MVVALGPGKFYGSSLPRPRFYTDVKYSNERIDPPLPVLDPFLSWANDAHWSMGGLSFTHHRLQGRIEGNIKKLRAENEILKKRKREENENPMKEDSDRPFIRSPDSVSPPPAPRATKQRRCLALVDEDSEPEELVRRRKPARKLGDDFDKVACSERMVKEKRKLERSDNEDGVESRGSPLKNKRGGGKEMITDRFPSPSSLSIMAYRTRSQKSEKDDVFDEGLVEEVEKANGSSSNPRRSKKRKLQAGKKIKTNGEKGSPANANGIRTSPRLAKSRLN